MAAWPRPPQHPLAALDAARQPSTRSNPLFREEEEQEIAIDVDSLDISIQPPRTPPSNSSGYGSGASGSESHGRSTPSPPAVPKTRSQEDTYDHLKNADVSRTDKQQAPVDAVVVRISPSEQNADGPLSTSLQEDIKLCLDGLDCFQDIEGILSAALEGSGGIAEARLRLQSALFALGAALPLGSEVPNLGLAVSHMESPASQFGALASKVAALPYSGPGVRPGDVTMVAKSSDMSILAASALFTLDAARGEQLAHKLARGRRRRRRCRAALAILALSLLLAAVGAAELLLSRGSRLFGAPLQ